MIITLPDLEKLITDVLGTEYPKDQADLIKEVVLFGELSGRPTHGIIRLIKENHGVFVDKPRGTPIVTHKTTISTLIDGQGNPGMLIGPLAILEAIRLAKLHGIGIVGTKGSVNSTGALSYYCYSVVKKGYIAMLFSQASATIAPFHTKKALFGTNPLAFGIPSDPPIIFDMSTSAVTLGAIMKAKTEGTLLPPNVAIDETGQETRDPKAVKATLPFDNSHKGSGLAMMIELLGSLWPGASFEGLHTEDGNGNVFLVLSPELLSDTETLRKKAQEFMQTLKMESTTEGAPVRIPGEHTIAIFEEHKAKGTIDVSDEVMKKIKQQMR